MRVIFFLFLPILLASCCLGIPKCPENYNSARFRIIGSANGQDLVFGTSHIYDKDLIKFFSLNGVDTIFHYYRAGPNPNPGQDSLLYVNFDYRKKEIVFVMLTNSDVDTLNLRYQTIDRSPCCPDGSEITPYSYNNNLLKTISGGITIITK